MTAQQLAIAAALGRCTFSPGTAAKRFARWAADKAANEPAYELSAKAAAFLERLAHSYRRQLGRCMAESCTKCKGGR